MALNFQQLGMLAKLKSAFSTFQQEHPKFMPFIQAIKMEGHSFVLAKKC